MPFRAIYFAYLCPCIRMNKAAYLCPCIRMNKAAWAKIGRVDTRACVPRAHGRMHTCAHAHAGTFCLYSYGLYSCGPYISGLLSYGLWSYGVYSYGTQGSSIRGPPMCGTTSSCPCIPQLLVDWRHHLDGVTTLLRRDERAITI